VAVLIASAVRIELSGKPLLDGVSLTVDRKDRVALAGANGAGKTTLLRAIAGELELAGGELALEKGARVALHDQRPPRASGQTLREYVLGGASDIVAAEAELARLERAMAGGEHGPRMLRRYAAAQARLEHAGGYGWRDRVGATIRGLGFDEQQLDRDLATFSGGELTRAALARSLGGDPDLLLLDEPTNHLDLESLEWLEQTLQGLDAAVVVVAHDRWFLEATTTAVLELEGGRSTFFPGPWHEWRRERAARLAAQEREAGKQADELERLERFVARFRYGTKARQAQSKLKRIERIQRERVIAPRRERRTLGFDFLKPARSGDVVVATEGLAVHAGGRRLVQDVTLVIGRGEHVALVGPNGSGKTTLLETLLGHRQPAAGSVRLGYGVDVAYCRQHDLVPQVSRPGGRGSIHETSTILDATIAATGLNRPHAQALLGRFLFSGWEMHERPVGVLSGGERRRLALAITVASGANFLVLDEPTNHLDMESREALEAALEAFPGTVLLVSHDRALLDSVATRIVALEHGTACSVDGGWAEYVRLREEGRDAAKAAVPTRPRAPVRRPERPRRPARARELERLEADIAAKEAAVADLERRLAEDWGDTALVASYRRGKDDLEAMLARWEDLFERAQAEEANP
jgi:ATP-binding cassette subfamily F protein 3